jgi:RNA polymerase sigma factor (sigma-70 family)
MKKLTDTEIIESVLKGNNADYSLLIDRYKDRGYSLLNRMLKNEMDAEEALQDGFLKAFNSLKSFRMESKFSTWFYKIIYNTALTVISDKKRKIQMEMSSIEDHFNLEEKDETLFSESENSEKYILKLVEKLPVKNSLVVILFYVDNLTVNEIGNVLGITTENTKVILHRSRIALKDLLIRHNYQENLL